MNEEAFDYEKEASEWGNTTSQPSTYKFVMVTPTGQIISFEDVATVCVIGSYVYMTVQHPEFNSVTINFSTDVDAKAYHDSFVTTMHKAGLQVNEGKLDLLSAVDLLNHESKREKTNPSKVDIYYVFRECLFQIDDQIRGRDSISLNPFVKLGSAVIPYLKSNSQYPPESFWTLYVEAEIPNGTLLDYWARLDQELYKFWRLDTEDANLLTVLELCAEVISNGIKEIRA